MFFVIIILLVSCWEPTQGFQKKWGPQLGTVEYPKQPWASPNVREGDIYRFGSDLMRAKFSGNLMEHSDPQNDEWTLLPLGTYINPKLFIGSDTAKLGDIFLDKKTGNYLKALCKTDDTASVELLQDNAECWEMINERQNWMTLLRDEIGDRRIGDIVLPGSHDSGTWGCGPDSYLVDHNAAYVLGMELTPETISNWSLTQYVEFTPQMDAGFRQYDLRIADMESENDTFYWYHAITGDPIFDGLDQIAEFATEHPEELLVLECQHFVQPGGPGSSTRPISQRRKDELADILIEKLGSRMAVQGNLGDNPTLNEILDTGKNLVTIMTDSYIRDKHEGFWPDIIYERWSSRHTPEDVFVERSDKMKDFKINHEDRITMVSGCTTPDTATILAGLLRVYADIPEVREILEEIAPELLEIDPDAMSFEGLYLDLLTQAVMGVNTQGMYARPAENYTNGASVHYHGVNKMYPYWLARPDLYKPSWLYVNAIGSSTVVSSAILANRGEIPREVSIAFQGNPRDGYLEWDEFQTVGGDEGLYCTANQARYRVVSDSYNIQNEWIMLHSQEEVIFEEGRNPWDAVVSLEVSSENSDWFLVYENNIQTMIEENEDWYLRGTDYGDGHGFAYSSFQYNLFGNSCEEPPENSYIDLLEW